MNSMSFMNSPILSDNNMIDVGLDQVTYEDQILADIKESNFPYRYVLFVILLSSLWTLVLTALPVLVDIPPDNIYGHHDNWYTLDDIIRIVEPFGGVLFNFWIFSLSDIYTYLHRDKSATICILTFHLGLALYCQGGAFHSASNMFKNALETIDDPNNQLGSLHYYMRVMWEHIISHYIYAAGYALMTMSQAYAYRNTMAPSIGLTFEGKVLLLSSASIFGLLIAGVAIDFPSGTIVGLIYCVLYGFCGLGGYMTYLYRHNKDPIIFQFGHRPIIHHFFLSFLIAFILIIIWIIIAGGFKARDEVM